MRTKLNGGLIKLILTVVLTGSVGQVSLAQTAPTLRSNVKTALSLRGEKISGSVQIELVRESVIVGIPRRLPNGQFDTALLDAITADQKQKKKHWSKSPPIIAKIFHDGQHPYREHVPAGGLECDIYYPGDKDLPDYIRSLVERDQAAAKLDPSYPAPPFYYKMDVDENYGPRGAFRDFGHWVFRQSTDAERIERLLEKRRLAQTQSALTAVN